VQRPFYWSHAPEPSIYLHTLPSHRRTSDRKTSRPPSFPGKEGTDWAATGNSDRRGTPTGNSEREGPPREGSISQPVRKPLRTPTANRGYRATPFASGQVASPQSRFVKRLSRVAGPRNRASV